MQVGVSAGVDRVGSDQLDHITGVAVSFRDPDLGYALRRARACFGEPCRQVTLNALGTQAGAPGVKVNGAVGPTRRVHGAFRSGSARDAGYGRHGWGGLPFLVLGRRGRRVYTSGGFTGRWAAAPCLLIPAERLPTGRRKGKPPRGRATYGRGAGQPETVTRCVVACAGARAYNGPRRIVVRAAVRQTRRELGVDAEEGDGGGRLVGGWVGRRGGAGLLRGWRRRHAAAHGAQGGDGAVLEPLR